MYLFRECCDNLPLNIDAKSVTTACFLETQMNIKTSDLCAASEEVMACKLPCVASAPVNRSREPSALFNALRTLT